MENARDCDRGEGACVAALLNNGTRLDRLGATPSLCTIALDNCLGRVFSPGRR